MEHRLRSVVRVEGNGVEAPLRCRQRIDDAADPYFDAIVVERTASKARQRPSNPVDDRRDQLADGDARIRTDRIERCAKRVAHAKTADENPYRFSLDVLANQPCKGF